MTTSTLLRTAPVSSRYAVSAPCAAGAPSGVDAMPGAFVSPELLVEIVERVAADVERWTWLVDGLSSGGVRVDVFEGVEVWVVAWDTVTSTELHAHESAVSAFRTVEGVLTQIRPDAAGRQLPRKFAPGVTGVIEAGEVHDLRNELVGRAVSIHAYSPGWGGPFRQAIGADSAAVVAWSCSAGA